mgnify:CR=1 FL=1
MKYIGNDPEILKQFIRASASGDIAEGDTCIIEADGDIAAVLQTVQTEAVASQVVFDNNESGELFTVIKDPTEDKIAILYQHDDGFQSNDNDKYIAFASVSGTTITVGTPISFATQNTEYNYADAEYTDDGTILYCRRVDGGVGSILKAMVITPNYTANTVSTGTEVTVSSTSTNLQQGGALSKGTSGKFVTYYTYSPGSGFKARVLTVSGTSVSVGSEISVTSASVDYFNAAYDTDNDKHIVAYKDYDNSNYPTVLVGTLSGTSVSYGTAVVVDTVNAFGQRMYADLLYVPSLGKLAYSFYVNNIAQVYIGEVSGTSTTGWTGSSVGEYSIQQVTVYDENALKFVVAYYLNSPSGYYVKTGTISGSTITFGDRFSLGFSLIPIQEGGGAVYDSESQKVVFVNSRTNNTTPMYPSAVVYSTGFEQTNLTAENYIGVSDEAVSDGDQALVKAKGAISTKQSSLTAGSGYYVQNDGTLATTADDPSVFAGTAVSSTQLIVKG